MTALIIILVILVVALAVAAFLVRNKNQQANIARADELRQQAATRAQSTIAPAQERAAETAAKAEEARARAERAEAEAREAQVAAHHVEAEHEGQVRAADRLDPRVDHKADDYQPQVAGMVDQQPTPPSEVNADLEASSPDTASTTGTADTASTADSQHDTAAADTADSSGNPPLLPRRTPGAQEMPGKPIETDGGGGWFTRKDETDHPDRD